MSELRATISYNESTAEILDKAGEIWPEFAGNRSALFRKIAADWDRIRTESGGRTARLEQRMNVLETELVEMKQMLRQLLGDNHVEN